MKQRKGLTPDILECELVLIQERRDVQKLEKKEQKMIGTEKMGQELL